MLKFEKIKEAFSTRLEFIVGYQTCYLSSKKEGVIPLNNWIDAFKYIIIKVKLRVIFKKQSTFIYYKPNII